MAVALYRRPPDEKKIGAFGFKPSDFAAKPILVWPENKPSVETFIAMRRRWNVGMSGPVGLDLAALQHIWPLVRVRRRERQRVIHDLMVMEDAAIEVIHEKD